MVFKPQTFHGEPPAGEIDTTSLETRVADVLAVSEGVDATGITVAAIDSEVFLRGVVALPQEIDRAIEVALSVPGVGKVSVNLEVTNPNLG